jgi:hypothetical protein
MMKKADPVVKTNLRSEGTQTIRFSLAGILGILSLLLGVFLISDPTLVHPEWLLLIAGFVGFMFLFQGLRIRVTSFIITGSVILLVCLAVLIIIKSFDQLSTIKKAGIGSITFGFMWLVVIVVWYMFRKKSAWWITLPCLFFLSAGIGLVFSGLRWTDMVFWSLLGPAIAMLVWSLGAKLPGLSISGSLLLSAAMAVYFGWREYMGGLAFKNIGVMLVIFSLGWGLMILFWKMINGRSIWWPLIPAGVLAFAGWGLVIGGSPGTALTFITNTSSIMLIILGIYLLLLRGSLNKK